MAKLSLRQAAQQAGVSKSTILRAVQKGRLSADRTDKGGYSIDPAEVERVYGDRSAQQSSNGVKGQGATGDETAVLQAQLDGLKTQVDMMREQLDDLREQRDKWSDQAQSAQRMLTDSRPQKRGWFGFRETA